MCAVALRRIGNPFVLRGNFVWCLIRTLAAGSWDFDFFSIPCTAIFTREKNAAQQYRIFVVCVARFEFLVRGIGVGE